MKARLGMIGFAVLFAVAGSGPLPSPDEPAPHSGSVRRAAEDFSGVSGEPQMGDLASVRVESGTENTVAVPTFELTGPAPSRSQATGGSDTSTTSSGTPSSGKESTTVSGSGSFSSSQGQGGSSGQSSGNPSSGSDGSSGGGGSSQPDPNQICSMPAMC